MESIFKNNKINMKLIIFVFFMINQRHVQSHSQRDYRLASKDYTRKKF